MGKSKNQHKNKTNHNDSSELEKSKAYIILEIIQYIPNAVVSKTIIRKTTGNITAMSFAEGEQLEEKTSPFDTFVQIIDGSAEVIVNNEKHKLKSGEGFIIPAHQTHCFKAYEEFKMILTIIKSGYDDTPLYAAS